MAVVPEREDVQELLDLGLQHFERQSAEAPDQLQVLDPRKMRVKIRLLGNVPKTALERREVVYNAAAIEQDLTIARFQQADDHFHRCALSGPVGADIAENLAGTNGEINVAYGCYSLKTLGQMADFEHLHFGHRLRVEVP